MPNSNAERYRELAGQCEQRAAQARDPEAQRTYQELAREWRKLADQVEAQGG